MKRDIFLLGGCDLEMCAIKRLLKKYNKIFYDKNLKWGAKLSAYKDIIEKHKNDKIYAIELENDINANVIEIDHHNKNSSNPSSIEQIAEILGHKLSRFEKAVDINDSKYIDGLIENDFNLSDIKRIRRLDRKCQGVKKYEEKAAKKINLDSRIIEFNYEHFSPLNDRIYFEKRWRNYIIFNDKLTMFYGFDVEELKKFLKENGIESCFYGGGKRGFLGVERRLDKEILKKALEMEKKVISHHIFMFPFVIKEKEKEDFFKELEKKDWKKQDFKIDKVEYYNEFVYFYEHVRDVLYGLEENSLSVYREKKLDKSKINEYIIKLKNGKVYTLEVEDVSLRIFNASIGILSFHLNNYDYYNSDDILKINEFGRRIFPQFLDVKEFVKKTKESFLADKIILKINSEEYKEDFSKFENINIINGNDLKETLNKKLLPSFITGLIGDKIKPILDDRMFVVCFYHDKNDELINNLKNFDEKKNEYSYAENDWWYQYVFVDGSYKTCQNRIFCKDIIKKSTYDRWVEEGTLWGISRYSFVGISDWDLFLVHTKTMYYQMMVLLLMYRAMIVYFSDRVQDIVEIINKSKRNNVKSDIREIREKSKKLYGEYLNFLNGFYFKEITAQEQGIEIYKKALQIMEIEEYINDFDKEISELDNYIEIEVEKERNEELDKLNKIATIFLPPTFIASFLGINVGNFNENSEIKFLIAIIIMFLSMLVSELMFFKEEEDRIISKFISNFSIGKLVIDFIKNHQLLIIIIIVICLILLGL